MSAAVPIAQHWLEGPLGARLLELETRLLQEALHDVFGFELLQIGRWGPADALTSAARTQNRRWLAPDACGPGAIRASFAALPIGTASVEAVLLPHTLEQGEQPHELLREVERILVGEGSLLICGFNPLGLWGLRHTLSRRQFPAGICRMLTEHRTRDWLNLLGFEITDVRRYLFCGPWTPRMPVAARDWLEHCGPPFFPPLGGAYLLKARKRVRALTPVRPQWRRRPAIVGGLAEPTSRNAA